MFYGATILSFELWASSFTCSYFFCQPKPGCSYKFVLIRKKVWHTVINQKTYPCFFSYSTNTRISRMLNKKLGLYWAIVKATLMKIVRKSNSLTIVLKVQSCKLYNNKYMIVSTQITNFRIHSCSGFSATELQNSVYKQK